MGWFSLPHEDAERAMKSGDYDQALSIYRQLFSDCERNKFTCYGNKIIACLEKLGRYQEALDFIIKAGPSWAYVYEKLEEYRSRGVSIAMPQQTIRKMYTELCSTEGSGRCWFNPESEQLSLLDDMVRDGFVNEAIEALNNEHFSYTIWDQKKDLLRAKFYAKAQDWESAIKIYEKYNLLSEAGPLYVAAGEVEKALLWLLSEGKLDEAKAFCREQSLSQADTARWLSYVQFNVANFQHPLAKAGDIPAALRQAIFRVVGDEFNLLRDRLADGKDFECPEMLGVLAEEDGKSLQGDHGFLMWQYMNTFLPEEWATLYRIKGGTATADSIVKAMSRVRSSAATLENHKWYWCCKYWFAYFVSGQYLRGILVAQNILNLEANLKCESYEASSPKTCLLAIATGYEMVGDFRKALDWHDRADRERTDKEYRQHSHAQHKARLYLKIGDFVQAAGAIQDIDQYVTTQLYSAYLFRFSGEDARSAKVVDALIAQHRSTGQFEELAEFLANFGFVEEAASVHVELGSKAIGTKPRQDKAGKEKASEKLESSNVAPSPTCACGQRLESGWKLCPVCGKQVTD